MRKGLIILLLFLPLLGVRSVLAGSVVLNEIMANPSDNTEWVELFNLTNQTIDLSNWKIKDGNSVSSDDLTLSGQINPASFVTFDHTKGWLNDSGPETVTLLGNDNQQVDTYQYSGTTRGKTYARQPDGQNWVALADPTKGSSNNLATPNPTDVTAPTPTAVLTPTPQPTINNTPTPSHVSSTNSTPSKSRGSDTVAKISPPPSTQPDAIPIQQKIALGPVGAKSLVKVKYQIASVAGVSSPATAAASSSARLEVKGQRQSFFLWIGAIFIFVGLLLIGYIYFRKNEKNPLKLPKRY